MSDQLKRIRVVKVQNAEEEQQSDQFWKHTKYFEEVGVVDDEDDFEPDLRKLVKLDSDGSSSYDDDEEGDDDMVDDEDDIVDDGDDIVDSQSYEYEEQSSVQEVIVQSLSLAKTNLQSYSFIRGVHHIQDITQLTRLGTSSYVHFEDGLTYAHNPVLNRIYLGVPDTRGNTGHDEQEKTKTEFHGLLYRHEDQRYDLDFTLRQLRWSLARLQQGVEVTALQPLLKKIAYDHDTDREELVVRITTKIAQLCEQRALIIDEPYTFEQSLDQQYCLAKRAVMNAITPRRIQQDLAAKIVSLEAPQLNLVALFTAQTSLNETTLLNQLMEHYDGNSIPPSALLVFDHSLTHAVDLIKVSLKVKGSDAVFAHDVFEDFVKGFFGAVGNVPIDLDLYEREHFEEVFTQQLTLRQVTHQDVAIGLFVFVFEEDTALLTTTPTQNFYPYTSEQFLIGRPILSYMVSCFHLIYQRVNVLTEMTKSVSVLVGDKDMDLQELCLELIKRSLKGSIAEPEVQSLLRHILKDEMAMQTQGLIFLLMQFRRMLCSYQFDDISMQFFLVWVRGIPNSTLMQHTQLINNINTMNQDQVLEGVASHLRQPRCGLCRMQKIGNLVTIHNFDITCSTTNDDDSQHSLDVVL